MDSEVIEVEGVRGENKSVAFACRDGVWGNKTEFLVGDFKAGERTGNGTAKSRMARLVGDFVEDLEGEDGGPGKERECNAPLGEAEARVRVRAEILDGMASSGRPARGTFGTGNTSG